MANVYIEARPKDWREGAPIEDYVVEDHSNQVLATFKMQREATACTGWASFVKPVHGSCL
jgi:hypothetical protein